MEGWRRQLPRESRSSYRRAAAAGAANAPEDPNSIESGARPVKWDGLIAAMLADSSAKIVRVVEFVCGQPVPDDAAPVGRRLKDMTGSKREPGEADPLNLAATGRAAAPHQLARPDTYDECVALWQRREEEL